MKKGLQHIAALALLVLTNGVNAFAGNEPAASEHAGPTWRFAFSVFNFVLLVAILVVLLKKRTRSQFKDRAIEMREAIEQAKKLHDRTRWHLEEMKTKLKLAQTEAAQLVHGVQVQSELEQKEIITQANDMAARFKEDVKRTTEQEIARAKQELKTEVVSLASDLAEQKIKKEMTAATEQQLGREFLEGLAKKA